MQKRPKYRYISPDTVLARIALLPYQQRNCGLEEMGEDFFAALSIASPTLLRSVKKGDQRALYKAQRYLRRAATRATPFGAWASYGELSHGEGLPRVSESRSWVLDKHLSGDLLERRFREYLREHLCEATFYLNETLRVFSHSVTFLTKGEGHQLGMKLSVASWDDALELFRAGVSYSDLLHEFSGEDEERLQEWLWDLLDCGLIRTDAEPSPFVLEQALSQSSDSDPLCMAERLGEMQQSSTLELRERELPFQVAARFEAEDEADTSWREVFAETVSALPGLWNRRTALLKRIGNVLRGGSVSGAISLVTLAHQLFISRNNSPNSILDVAPNAEAKSQHSRGLGQDWLVKMMLDAILRGETAIDISTSPAAFGGDIVPPVVAESLLAPIVTNDSGETSLLHLATAAKLAETSSRFLFFGSAGAYLEQVRQSFAALESEFSDCIVAEVTVGPLNRWWNLCRRPAFSKYQIVLHGCPSVAKDYQICPDDLVIALRDDKPTLFSRRLKRWVMPILSSALSYSYLESPFLNLVMACSPQHAFWGIRKPEGSNLSVQPRVSAGRVVLLPRSWLIPAQIFEGSSTDAWNRWRDKHALHGEVRAQLDKDMMETSVIDVDKHDTYEEIRSTLSDHQFVTITETFEPAPLFVGSSNEHHIWEAACLLRRPPQQTRNHHPYPIRINEKEHVFPPLSSWYYARIYVGLLDQPYFLANEIRALTESAKCMGSERWHFVRYSDERGPHLRIRFKWNQQANWSELSNRIGELITQSVGNAPWDIGTYEREVERYGGADCMELVEELFEIDSEQCVAAMAADLEAGSEQHCLRWGVRSVHLLLASLNPQATMDIVTFMRGAWERARSPSDSELYSQRFRTVRNLFLEFISEIYTHEGVIDSSQLTGGEERFLQVAGLVAAQLGSRLHDVMNSICHMTSNRLFFAPQQEASLRYFHARALDSFMARHKLLKSSK